MAGYNEVYTTTVKLNSEEAKNRLLELQKVVDTLKQKRNEAFKANDMQLFASLGKDLSKAEHELKLFKNQTMSVVETLKHIDSSSVEQLEKAVRSLKRQQKKTNDENLYAEIGVQIQRCKERIDEFKQAERGATEEAKALSAGMLNLRNVMSNIGHASLNKLREAESYLKQQVSNQDPSSTSYATSVSQLKEVQAQILKIESEQKRVNQLIDQYDDEIKQAHKDMSTVQRETKLVNDTLRTLDHASVDKLQYSIKIINENLRHMDRGTAEFKQMSEQAKRLRTELAKVNFEGRAQQSWINRTADWFNKMQGMAIAAVASLSGVALTVRQCVSDFAKMDEELVNVQKYTGQTKQEVEEMNETFKNMNTRTPREKLNELAQDAGRLGIHTKQAVEEFVDGADKINVALGDDLGDDAVKNIGKLAQMFGEDKTKGLRGAMLATGSVVNELAQNSSAAGSYLVDFTARLAGVGKQAKLSQQQIMSYASVLDQNMQQDETAATAMSGLISKMFQNPAKFAKLAGQNVKEFSKLLKTDANEALLRFFAAMKAKGGFAQLAPMFEKMNLDGTRSVGVLSVMADKLDDVKKAQVLANQAYASGTSVLNEFNTQMSSEQAKLDIASKKFKEMRIELGKELMPVARYAITTGSILVKVLFTLINFGKEHIKGIIALTTVVAVLTATYKAGTIATYAWYVKENALLALQKVSVIWTKARIAAINTLKIAFFLLTGQISKAKAALEAMRVASLTNPYTAILTVVIALGYAIYKLVSYFKSQNEQMKKNTAAVKEMLATQKAMNEVTQEANKTTSEEITRMKLLRKTLTDNKEKLKDRKKALEEIQSIVPEYHGALTKEGLLIHNNSQVLDDYCNNLIKAAKAQAAFNKLTEIQAKSLDHEDLLNHRKGNQAFIGKKMKQIGLSADYGLRYVDGDKYVMEKLDEHGGKTGELKTISRAQYLQYVHYQKIHFYNVRRIKEEQQILDINQKISDKLSEIAKQADEEKKTTGGTFDPSGGGEDEKAKKKREAEERRRKAEQKRAMLAELKAAKAHTDELQAQNIAAVAAGLKTDRQFVNDQHRIAIAGIDDQIAIYKKYNEEYRQLSDDRMREEEEMSRAHNKFLLKDIVKRNQLEVAQAHADFLNVNSDIYMNEEALNERLYEIDMSAMADRIAALREGSEEWLDAKDEMERAELEHSIQQQRHFAELLSRYREQWWRKDVKQQQQIELMGLQTLYEKKLIKEKEYQEMRKLIIAKYEEEASEVNLKNSKGKTQRDYVDTKYRTVRNNAEADYENQHGEGSSVIDFMTKDLDIFATSWATIKKMEQDGVISHQEAMQMMLNATGDLGEGMVHKMQAAMDAIQPIMNAMSSYWAAQSDYEQRVTEKKYDKLINAAGKNSAKQKKLEEKKQKDIAKIKTKYNKKQMKMEIAQATATMLIGAMSAYTSALKGAPYPANQILAPLAAGIATAAGLLNIAAIKKQHAAEEAGYYEGGFTGGSNYRRRAGVVHEGEFVVNHSGVNNTALGPVLQMIDVAQRNNTIGQLSSADVSRQLGQGGAAVVAPVVNVANDNAELKSTLQEVVQVVALLHESVKDGIPAFYTIDGENGVARGLEKLKKLKNNV